MNKSPKEIMSELRDKFNGNFDEWLEKGDNSLETIFIYLQILPKIGKAINPTTILNKFYA